MRPIVIYWQRPSDERVGVSVFYPNDNEERKDATTFILKQFQDGYQTEFGEIYLEDVIAFE